MSVINGAKSIISRQRPIFLIEICKAHNSDYEGLLNLMKAANYTMFALYDDRLDIGTISQIDSQPLSLTPLQLESARKYVWDFLFVPEEKCMNLVGSL